MNRKKPLFGLSCIIITIFLLSCNGGTDSAKQFTNLSSSHTGIDFINKPEKHKLFNILYYLYYYNGGGVATGDINNDGLPDIYFTANNKAGNKLYLNKGNLQFEDITSKAGVAGTADWCTGVTMADVNGDGFLDIYVSAVTNKYGLKGRNELFINNGDGTFKEKGAEYGLDVACFTTQTAFFDYDNDGDLDCFILNQSHHPHANIIDTSGRRKYDPMSGDRLYRNDRNTAAGKFVDVSAQAGIYQSNLGYGLGIGVADLNNDGWIDIYVGNDFHENDYYYINNGNGTFTESGAKHFGHYSRFSMGNDISDYNNDGQPDIITVDMLPPDEATVKTYGSDENPDTYKFKLEQKGYQQQFSKNCLQRNNGNGSSFSDVALMAGVAATDWSWAPLFADFDNDGRKDLFVSSGIVKRPVDLDYVKYVSDLKFKGMDATDKFDDDAIAAMPDGSSHPFFFRSDSSYLFKDVSVDWGTEGLKGYFTGAAYADLDNDGDLDVVINKIDDKATILRNNAGQTNALTVSLKGNTGNTFGLGAKVYLFSNGGMQLQEVMATRGFQSASDTRAHFGLHSSTSANSLWIIWPGNKMQVIKNVAANKALVVNQTEALDSFNFAARFPAQAPLLQEYNVNAGWTHKEDEFIDFNVQYLIPHALSTRGPKLAVADVNGDGRDDYYAPGNKYVSGYLMIQQADGSFRYADTTTFKRTGISKDVDAVFFDANKDGFPDLCVVSGGNQEKDNGPGLADRLFLNDGKGKFTEAKDALPAILVNKSCVKVADVDNDGDMDLFIGGLANANKYGFPQSSYLLINDGTGKFSNAAAGVIQLSDIGMVTSSVFTDVNKDGWIDLVVTGEWMPLKLFINNKGKFISSDLPRSTGLWQTLYTTDVNGDGFMDILAGNWGHNSKLYAGKDGPLKLYVKDFDNNGSFDQVMAYTIDGKEYSFLAKDELERQMPVLKKAYLKYQEVAGKTVQYMLYDLFKDYKELKAEVLGSSCFINNGKGGFDRVDLPADLQLAPIMAFNEIGKDAKGNNRYVAGGNFFDVVPYEGRYDAQPLAVFTAHNNKFDVLPQVNLSAIKGQVRDVSWLRTGAGERLLVSRNNAGLLFFGYPAK